MTTQPTTEKYYTPSIEEFHVGFEYEIFEDFDTLPEKIWHKQVYGVNGADPERIDHIHASHLDKVRVKYLDHDDIVAEGWNNIADKQYGMKKSEEVYILDIKEQQVDVINAKSIRAIALGEHKTLFSGTIRNRSELRQIMRMLNIH